MEGKHPERRRVMTTFHKLRRPVAFDFTEEDRERLDSIQTEGLCNGRLPQGPPDNAPAWLFFPDARKKDYKKQVAMCASICSYCPMLDECGEHGIAHEDYGYWGGMSIADRIRERKLRDGN